MTTTTDTITYTDGAMVFFGTHSTTPDITIAARFEADHTPGPITVYRNDRWIGVTHPADGMWTWSTVDSEGSDPSWRNAIDSIATAAV